jgi:hypothetical protein
LLQDVRLPGGAAEGSPGLQLGIDQLVSALDLQSIGGLPRPESG